MILAINIIETDIIPIKMMLRIRLNLNNSNTKKKIKIRARMKGFCKTIIKNEVMNNKTNFIRGSIVMTFILTFQILCTQFLLFSTKILSTKSFRSLFG